MLLINNKNYMYNFFFLILFFLVLKKKKLHICDFRGQTGLHLLTTANAGSDESIADDRTSSTSEDKRSKSEVR